MLQPDCVQSFDGIRYLHFVRWKVETRLLQSVHDTKRYRIYSTGLAEFVK